MVSITDLLFSYLFSDVESLQNNSYLSMFTFISKIEFGCDFKTPLYFMPPPPRIDQ